ncbi:hypothetical protein QTP88_008645 [Uroleucon formosanum]
MLFRQSKKLFLRIKYLSILKFKSMYKFTILLIKQYIVFLFGFTIICFMFFSTNHLLRKTKEQYTIYFIFCSKPCFVVRNLKTIFTEIVFQILFFFNFQYNVLLCSKSCKYYDSSVG